MKILAQYGHGDGTKTSQGIEAGYLDGVIFRPRDISPEKLSEKILDLRERFPDANILFDPQLYAGVILANPNIYLGKLEEYRSYLTRIILGRLETRDNVLVALNSTLEFQKQLDLTAIIAPNIVIRRSFDSREAVIAKSFIRETKAAWARVGDDRKVFATLAIGRDALFDRELFQEFLNDLTSIENPPDGFYLIISNGSRDARVEIFNPEVISGWMLLNYALKINGLEIINGYSDLISPLLGAVGGDFGATGWRANSRSFSLQDQFAASLGGGSQAIQRYLSLALWNRITFYEFRDWRLLLPEIQNGLPTDNDFADDQSEPERAREVLQSWNSLTILVDQLTRDDVRQNLDNIIERLRVAASLYANLSAAFGIRPDVKSNADHVEPLVDAIRQFERVAEL